MRNFDSILSWVNSRPYIWLIAGIVLITGSHMTYGIDILAWISSVPFLIYLNITRGWKSRALFFTSLVIAWSFVVLKIVSPPIPHAMIFLFSFPISVFHLPGYLIGGRILNRRYSVFLFPTIMVIMEWIQYTFTPFAGWGAAAYSQVNTLSMIQTVSVLGVPGLSFIIYWVNSSIASILLERKTSPVTFAFPLTILVVALIFGNLRLNVSRSSAVETIKVAAVGTDSDVAGLPLPSDKENTKVINDLFDRTRVASTSGAKLVVWNEASFFTLPENENHVIQQLQSLADSLNISLVSSYVVPVSTKPLKYNNKYVLIDNHGKLIHTYHKHEPVPGEPAKRGDEPLQVTTIGGAKVGGAICYDYDFPYLAKQFGNLDADIVALPSSDWRGIDPLHTQMAAFRAVEQGHSIIRSTRFGLSAAISPHGDLINQMSSFDDNSKIMISEVPVKGVKTLYSIMGDVLILFLGVFIIFYSYSSLRQSRQIAKE